MTKQKMDISFFTAGTITDKYFEIMLAEYAANHAKYLALSDGMLRDILDDPVRFIILREWMHRNGLQFRDAHGLWGSIHDLNSDDRQFRPKMVERHKLAMGYAKDAGCLTYTVHIGAQCCYNPYYSDPAELRKLAADTLAQLIPEAEKLDIMLCVENNYEPPNSADEVLHLIGQFSSKNLGVCYDSGHANIMCKAGKDLSRYGQDLLIPWKNEIIFDDDTLDKLLPHIVTCHLHDNNGYSDEHALPGNGTIEWDKLMAKLRTAPRLMTLQAECAVEKYKVPVRTLCETYGAL